MNPPNKKYFFDTEFHEYEKPVKILGFTIKKVRTIELISIGIVCEDGRTFYAINKDFNYKNAKKNKWLKENVLDKLPPKNVSFYDSPRIRMGNRRWMSLEKIKKNILIFCGALPEFDDYGTFYKFYKGKPEFYAYYADYDWVVFCWIFGTMMELPDGFPMYCKDIKQMLDLKTDQLKIKAIDIINDEQDSERLATLEEKLRFVKTLKEYPTIQDEHNALADAYWNYQLYNFINNVYWKVPNAPIKKYQSEKYKNANK